jgi:hypothetical protein
MAMNARLIAKFRRSVLGIPIQRISRLELMQRDKKLPEKQRGAID